MLVSELLRGLCLRGFLRLTTRKLSSANERISKSRKFSLERRGRSWVAPMNAFSQSNNRFKRLRGEYTRQANERVPFHWCS